MNKDGQRRVYAYFTRLCMALWQCHCQFTFNHPIDYPGTATLPLPRFIHPRIFTSIHFIHWLLPNGMLCPNMLYVYQLLTRSRRQLVDCSTPGPRSNVVVFNLILSHKTIFNLYYFILLIHIFYLFLFLLTFLLDAHPCL